MSAMRVAVCYYEGRSTHPSFSADDADASREIYWHCIVAALTTARRFGGRGVRPTLFTNVAAPEKEQAALLSEIGAEIIRVEFTYAPPDEGRTLFRGSLYLLDAIAWATATLDNDETILFIDPDCLVTGDLADAARHIARFGMSAYRIWYPRDHDANGQSRAGLRRWLNSVDAANHIATDPVWLGGEYLGLTGAGARRLAEEIAQVWAMNLADRSAGAPSLKTEEHVLSAAAAHGGLCYHDAGRQFVRRIWTRGRYRNFNNRMAELCIWHLPGEKTGAMRDAYRIIAADPDALDGFIAKRNFLRNRSRNLKYLAYSFVRKCSSVVAGEPTDFELDQH